MKSRAFPFLLVVLVGCSTPEVSKPAEVSGVEEEVSVASELRRYTPPMAAEVVEGTSFETGCMSYDQWDHCLFCVVGEETMQAGGDYVLETLGCTNEDVYQLVKWEGHFAEDATRRIAKEDQEDLAQRLLRFTPEVPEPEPFAPNGEPFPLGSRAELRWNRTVSGEDGDETTGVWETFEGELEVGCLRDGQPTKYRALGESLYDSDGEPSALVWHLGSKVIVLTSWSLAVEGDFGSATVGAWVDLDKECGSQ